MQLQLTITADTAQEFNKAIIDLAGTILSTATPTPDKPVKEKKVVESAKAEEPKVEETKTETKVKSDITIEDIRALMQQKAANGKREEAKALLASYGATKLQDLDTAKYAEFKTALTAL